MIKISDKLTTFGNWLECSDERVDSVYMWPVAWDNYKGIDVVLRLTFKDGRKELMTEGFHGVNFPDGLIEKLIERGNKYLSDENSTEEVQ
jgi:hypothetical protein